MIKFKELKESAGAGDWGTDQARKKLQQDTPGQGITDIGVKNKERKESVEFAESEYKVIKVVGDDFKNMKKRTYGTFPATDKGRDQATVFQLKLKRQKGVEADLVWESLDELDEITFHQGIGSGGDEVMKQLLKILKKSGKAPDIQKRLERELKNTDKKEEVDLDEATDFRSGDTVYQVGSKLRGKVLHKGNRDQIFVKFGSITKSIPASELRLAESVELEETRKYKVVKGDKERMINKQELRTYLQMGWKQVKEEAELDELSMMTKAKAKIARGIRGPSDKATPAWARETGKAAKELKKRAAQKAEYEKKKKAMQQRGALTSFKVREQVELDEAIDLQERPFGGDSVIKDLMPGIYNFLDRTVNNKRYKFAIRMFLDLRKKNPKDARNNLVKAAKIADVDVRVLDRLFRNMVKKGVMPKHLMNYYPTFVEGKSFKDIAEKACWDGYKQVGMKKKNGKEVPNCVPEDKE